jgi:hypothetical protein
MDPERFRLPDGFCLPPPRRQGAPRPRRGEKFLMGPVPWAWLQRASRLHGRALHVGIAVWFLAGFEKSATVPLAASVLRASGVTRWAAARGLRDLETAGLVTVERRSGRQPRVTLLWAP